MRRVIKLNKKIKGTALVVLGLVVVFVAWFTCVQVSVYGDNYHAVMENLDIVIKKPQCLDSFSRAESLKRKFSYKLYLWLKLDENKKLNPTIRLEKVPEELIADYFYIGEDATTAQKRLECEFSNIRMELHPDIGEEFIYFVYVYYNDIISIVDVFHAGIYAHINEGKISEVSGDLHWGIR